MLDINWVGRYQDRSPFLVAGKGMRVYTAGLFLAMPAAIAIYSMFLNLLIMDISLRIYQFIYFSVMKIPKVPRSDYLIIDRHQLDQLTGFQKLNCVYCGYANGVAAWSLAIAQQTEMYSCAIKHQHPAPGQANQKHPHYRERSEFTRHQS